MSIVVGVIVISAVSWIIATFGMYPFQISRRIVLVVRSQPRGPKLDVLVDRNHDLHASARKR